MSALEWLKAGATGSYGTVVEPCNHLGKFPHPGILMTWYAEGNTLIEAYWKSVAWPGEGVFIGEPLARPFGTRVLRDDAGWWVESTRPPAAAPSSKSLPAWSGRIERYSIPDPCRRAMRNRRLLVCPRVGAVRVS
jgi:hypothetical protein